MADFNVSVVMDDAFGRQTTRRFELSGFVDQPAAKTWMDGTFIPRLEAISDAGVVAYNLTERVVVSDSPGASANIDEGLTLVFRKADGYKAIARVVAPDLANINADGSVDLAAAAVMDWVGLYTSTPGLVLSDGEVALQVLSGSLDK